MLEDFSSKSDCGLGGGGCTLICWRIFLQVFSRVMVVRCVQCDMQCVICCVMWCVQCVEWKFIYFCPSFFGRGYVYNMVGCSVIPVVLCPYFGGEMQQSTICGCGWWRMSQV